MLGEDGSHSLEGVWGCRVKSLWCYGVGGGGLQVAGAG